MSRKLLALPEQIRLVRSTVVLVVHRGEVLSPGQRSGPAAHEHLLDLREHDPGVVEPTRRDERVGRVVEQAHQLARGELRRGERMADAEVRIDRDLTRVDQCDEIVATIGRRDDQPIRGERVTPASTCARGVALASQHDLRVAAQHLVSSTTARRGSSRVSSEALSFHAVNKLAVPLAYVTVCITAAPPAHRSVRPDRASTEIVPDHRDIETRRPRVGRGRRASRRASPRTSCSTRAVTSTGSRFSGTP